MNSALGNRWKINTRPFNFVICPWTIPRLQCLLIPSSETRWWSSVSCWWPLGSASFSLGMQVIPRISYGGSGSALQSLSSTSSIGSRVPSKPFERKCHRHPTPVILSGLCLIPEVSRKCLTPIDCQASKAQYDAAEKHEQPVSIEIDRPKNEEQPGVKQEEMEPGENRRHY